MHGNITQFRIIWSKTHQGDQIIVNSIEFRLKDSFSYTSIMHIQNLSLHLHIPRTDFLHQDTDACKHRDPSMFQLHLTTLKKQRWEASNTASIYLQVNILKKFFMLWIDLIAHDGSMSGMFTYIYHKSTKCR